MDKNKETFEALIRQYQLLGGTITDLEEKLAVSRQTIHNYMKHDTLSRAAETLELFDKTQTIVEQRRTELAALLAETSSKRDTTEDTGSTL